MNIIDSGPFKKWGHLLKEQFARRGSEFFPWKTLFLEKVV